MNPLQHKLSSLREDLALRRQVRRDRNPRPHLAPLQPFDPNSLAVCIVTYNRPAAINRAIAEWLASTPPTVPVYVISNHSTLELERDYGDRLNVLMNSLRPDDSLGYLTRNWNQCFLLALRDHDWVICSQDDVTIAPGWIELIQDAQPRDIYVAPQGDVVFLMNRNVLLTVGWFDECFTQIGSHEFDFWFRCHKILGPDRMSFVDEVHGWKDGDGSINPIGLERHWRSTFRDDETYRDWIAVGDDNRLRWVEKWGALPRLEWNFSRRRIRARDVNWYPWFIRKLNQ